MIYILKALSFLTFILCAIALAGAYYNVKDCTFTFNRADYACLCGVGLIGLNGLVRTFI